MSAEIQYIVKPHPVTGVTNAKLGIWLFLASEIMLFGALFSTYILLRVGAPSWPRGADLLNVPLATLNTAILIASSVTMVLAYAAVQLNNIAKFRRYLGLTILLSFGFLVVKGFEYVPKFKHYEVWCAWLLGVVQIPFIINFFASIKLGKKVNANPWEATTLEWAAPSPPPHGNFAEVPAVYRGPYEYSPPGSETGFAPQHVVSV